VGEGLDDEPDPHDVAQPHACCEPLVDGRADQSADGGRRGEQAEADLASPQAFEGVEDQHRPGRAEGDVEDDDGQGQGPHRGMSQQPAEPFGDVVAHRAPPRGRLR